STTLPATTKTPKRTCRCGPGLICTALLAQRTQNSATRSEKETTSGSMLLETDPTTLHFLTTREFQLSISGSAVKTKATNITRSMMIFTGTHNSWIPSLNTNR